MPAPNPGHFAQLADVALVSSYQAWAVGIHSEVENFLSLALHCC